MLFKSRHYHQVLQLALEAAIATHRTDTLRGLVATHGSRACARALSKLPLHTIADALSTVAPEARHALARQLPWAARQALRRHFSPEVLQTLTHGACRRRPLSALTHVCSRVFSSPVSA